MRRMTLLAVLLSASSAIAQVPSGATSVKLTVVNTIKGVTTWSFTDPSGTYFLQSNAYLTIATPEGPSSIYTLAAPALWFTGASTPPPPTGPTASPDKTVIQNNSGSAIYDAALNKWTVVNGVVLMNGAPIGFSSGVTELVIVSGVLWQENTALNWYKWTLTTKEWDQGAKPI